MSGDVRRAASWDALRCLVAVADGIVLQFLLLAAVWGFLSWWGSSTAAECAPTDCQPQYFFAQGVLGFLVLLPGAFILGCMATWGVWSVTFRSATARKPRLQTQGLPPNLPAVGGTHIHHHHEHGDIVMKVGANEIGRVTRKQMQDAMMGPTA